ncbi:MAG: hypothetical protein IKE43_09390, partial [Coriobacteriales bacterium]|nr:hypothetical protein [Coriobacteriales bacterium]
EMETKLCTSCGRVLPVSSFNRHIKNADGLRNICKSCISRYNKAYNEKEADRQIKLMTEKNEKLDSLIREAEQRTIQYQEAKA